MSLFNDERNVKAIMREGVLENDKFAKSKMRQVALYLRDKAQYTQEMILSRLQKVTVDYFYGMSDEYTDMVLTEIIKNASGMKYIERSPVDIYYSEINVIMAIDNPDLQKLAFVFLVYSKSIYQKPIYHRCRNVEILKEAKLYDKRSGSARNQLLYKLNEQGLVRFKVDYGNKFDVTNKFKVLFQAEGGDVAFTVTSFENILSYLAWYKQEPDAIICINCGCPTMRTSPAKKFCGDCAAETKRRQNRVYALY
jgi:hypothetical protein